MLYASALSMKQSVSRDRQRQCGQWLFLCLCLRSQLY